MKITLKELAPSQGATPDWIKQLHKLVFDSRTLGEQLEFARRLLELSMRGGRTYDPLRSGEYRPSAVHINYNEKTTPQLHPHLLFEMPDWRDIPVLIEALCDDLTSRWNTADPYRIAAEFVIGVRSIHPFLDCNGRVSRLGAHLILCSKLGLDVRLGPGTLPEIMVGGEYRKRWFQAVGMYTEGIGDVPAMERLLQDCLSS
jgi:Fic family protein